MPSRVCRSSSRTRCCRNGQAGVAADDHTAYYVVNLLTLFARHETLYDQGRPGPGLQPLALLLAAAADSRDRETRNALLRRVGDTSLFVAGFLGDGFARKLVDVDYYIDMGGAAYGRLSDNVRGTRHGPAFGSVFAELAAKFGDSSTCLPKIRDWARPGDRRCCGFTSSGCARAAPRARQLREHGLNRTRRLASRHGTDACTAQARVDAHELYALDVAMPSATFLITDAALASSLDAVAGKSTRSS